MIIKKLVMGIVILSLMISAVSAMVLVSDQGNVEINREPGDNLSEGLVAYWNFDEGSGNILHDVSGHGNNGIIYGATWVKGVKGDALSFDGVHDFVDCGNSSYLNIKDAITVAAWIHPMSNGWKYVKPVYLEPSTPKADYQVKIELNTSNFDYSKARQDGGDLRFYQLDGTKLNYWIENWNPYGTSTIWVKVDKKGTSEIYMYYGNSEATTESNGTATFDFFDDFKKYEVGSNITGQGGWVTKRIGGTGEAAIRVEGDKKYLHLSSTDNATSVVHLVSTNNSGYAIQIKEFADEWPQSISLIFSDGQVNSKGEPLNGYESVWWGWGGEYSKIRRWDNGTPTVLASISDEDKDYVNHTLEFSWYGSQLDAYRDGKLMLNSTDATFASQTYIQLKEWSGSSRYVKWVFVRKYASPEPRAVIGNETAVGIFKAGSYGIGAQTTKAFASIDNHLIAGDISAGWNYIVMTYDGSVLKLYANNSLIASEMLNTTISTNLNKLLLGFLYKGDIDEMRIYNRSLNTSEIKELYYQVVPMAPTNLTVEKERGKITLTWTPPANNGTVNIGSYEIYRSENGVNFTNVGSTGNTSYSDALVKEGKNYSYFVVAVSNDDVIGDKSEKIGVEYVLPPTAPLDINITQGDAFVNLTWGAPADDGGSAITTYRVYRNDTLIATVSATQLWYNDTGVINGYNYTYYVTAVNGVGESEKSNEVQATPETVPAAPQNLKASAGDGYVNLTWSAPADDGGAPVTGYHVYRDGVLIANLSANQTWYKDTHVKNGVKYTYYITAVNVVGEGPRSENVSATPTYSGGGNIINLYGAGSNIWLWVGIGAIVAALLVVVAVMQVRKTRRKENTGSSESESEEEPAEQQTN